MDKEVESTGGSMSLNTTERLRSKREFDRDYRWGHPPPKHSTGSLRRKPTEGKLFRGIKVVSAREVRRIRNIEKALKPK